MNVPKNLTIMQCWKFPFTYKPHYVRTQFRTS